MSSRKTTGQLGNPCRDPDSKRTIANVSSHRASYDNDNHPGDNNTATNTGSS
jgi:hypothetical protein